MLRGNRSIDSRLLFFALVTHDSTLNSQHKTREESGAFLARKIDNDNLLISFRHDLQTHFRTF